MLISMKIRMNKIVHNEISEGRNSGSNMSLKARRGDAPQMRAASGNSSETCTNAARAWRTPCPRNRVSP